MRSRFTSAHWGSYRAEGDGDGLRHPAARRGSESSVIGRGWLDATRDATPAHRRAGGAKGLAGATRSRRAQPDSFVEIGWDEALDLAAERAAAGSREPMATARSSAAPTAGRAPGASTTPRASSSASSTPSAAMSAPSTPIRTPPPKCCCRTSPACRIATFQDEMTSWPLSPSIASCSSVSAAFRPERADRLERRGAARGRGLAGPRSRQWRAHRQCLAQSLRHRPRSSRRNGSRRAPTPTRR